MSESNACPPQEAVVEEKAPDCPKILNTTLKGEKPKAEVRRIQYDDICSKCGHCIGPKKPGSEVCCPSQSKVAKMSCPPYSDLGKKAKDVFGKGYHFGLVKLDCKTKTATGVEFTSGGTSNVESGKVVGQLESKYKVKEHGLTFTERWTTDNALTTEIAVADKVPGLKVSGDLTFSPPTGSKSGHLKGAYAHEKVALNLEADLGGGASPLLNGSLVLTHMGWLAGYQTAFDVNETKLTKNNFALGFTRGDFALHTNVDDGKNFGGAIYQKLTPRLESAVQVSWASDGNSPTKLGIGAKLDLEQDAAVRVKVDNSNQLGLGYQQKLREGVTVTLSALIDAKDFANGGHKIGLALELEA